MRSDDLVPLLTKPAAGPGVSFRQGVIVSWNQETAQNTVLVGGSLMSDLPILNTSEAAILAEGDVVGIMTAGATWGILGRFTIPGTPEAVSALSSLRTQSASISATETVTGTSYAAAVTDPGPEVTIAVGPSGRLIVLVSATVSGQSTKTAGNTANAGGGMGVVLTGANARAAADSEALRATVNATITSSAATIGVDGSASRVVLLTGLTPGLTTITAVYRMIGNGTQVNFSNRNVTAIAI